MKRKFVSFASLALFAGLIFEPQAVADHNVLAAGQSSEKSGFYKPGPTSKADTALAQVVAEHRAHIAKGQGTAFKPSSKFVQVSAGQILIDARALRDGGEMLADLTQLGLINGSRYGDIVSGLLPYAAIERALALPSVRSMSAARRPIRHAGAITSQGDVALRANIARSAFAVDGTGVTVGVVSDSYDTLGGAAADVVSGDLPSTGVPVLNGESTYCGVYVFCVDEGRAMLQIIHDVAPGADLLFQSGIEGIAAYANAIANLAANGADIIVDDLLIINEPMFQDGIVAQAVDAAVAGGTTYFTAAGNSGRQSYEAPFVDSGEIFCIEFFEPFDDCDPIFERVGRMHDFDPGPGVDNYLNITVPVNGVMTIAMQWDQPYGGPGPTTDHDIVLLDGTGESYIPGSISANDNIIMGEGWEALQLDNNEVLDLGTEFSIIITYDDVDSIDPPASLVKLVIFGEGITIDEWVTNSGALFGHPNATGAQAVGAAFYMDTPENGTSPPVLRPFSSAGGTPVLFDTNGVRLTEPVIRQAPEVVAVDGVNTTFFFDDSIGSDGIDDFVGTSAAAPHAAGVAALVLEAKPSALPDELGRALQNSALDMGVPGVDYDSGHGLIQADAAIAAVLASYPQDMNGNGQADILWRNSASGQNWLYLMSGASIVGSIGVNTVPTTWEIVGNGDYNGDTNADILWRNSSTGQNWMYLMSGATIASSVGVNTVPAPWKIAGNGDYNGDGNADILWRNSSTGQNWMYLMDGATITSSLGVNTVPVIWDIVGNSDYNGDGNADILWRNSSSGQNWMYLMNGAAIDSSVGVNTVSDTAWTVAGSGDYNGDGNADILWRNNSTGQNWVYLMNGASIATSAGINTVSTVWQIAGSGDYDGDGKSDLLWRHGATGQNWLYLMNGATIASSIAVNTVATGWEIVNID
ncbi:MAG: FG-GAP-like repeat-containing protein [Gammaproteobacteria bacterium]|nr:FG-GAP-like repeat-containing protein [Gammaproteobacteria bacterium]